MKRPLRIEKNSLTHFIYNSACILVAGLTLGAMRHYPQEPFVFWMGMAILVICLMAFKWMNDPPADNVDRNST